MPITSDLDAAPIFRITIDPSKDNGLAKVSQVMIDKVATILRGKVGQVIGRLEDTTMLKINRAIAVWLGLA